MGAHLITAKDRFAWYQRQTLTMPDKVAIIEDFIGNDMTIQEVSRRHGVSYDYVCSVIKKYWSKPKYGLSIMSKI